MTINILGDSPAYLGVPESTQYLLCTWTMSGLVLVGSNKIDPVPVLGVTLEYSGLFIWQRSGIESYWWWQTSTLNDWALVRDSVLQWSGIHMELGEDLNSTVVIIPAVCPLANYSTSVILVFPTVQWDNTHLCYQSGIK